MLEQETKYNSSTVTAHACRVTKYRSTVTAGASKVIKYRSIVTARASEVIKYCRLATIDSQPFKRDLESFYLS